MSWKVRQLLVPMWSDSLFEGANVWPPSLAPTTKAKLIKLYCKRSY